MICQGLLIRESALEPIAFLRGGISQFVSELLKKGVMLNSKAKKKMAAGWKSAIGAMNLWCYEVKLDVSDVINGEETGSTD